MDDTVKTEKDLNARWALNSSRESVRKMKKLRRRDALRRDAETNESIRRMVNRAVRRG